MYIYMYIDWADLGWLYAWARMGLWRRMLMSWNWHMQLMLRCKLNGAWPGDDLGPKMGVKCISIWRGGGVEVLYIYVYIFMIYYFTQLYGLVVTVVGTVSSLGPDTRLRSRAKENKCTCTDLGFRTKKTMCPSSRCSRCFSTVVREYIYKERFATTFGRTCCNRGFFPCICPHWGVQYQKYPSQ